MGAIAGTLKFVTGVILGAATGATVATLIMTRDAGQTVTQLRAAVDDMVEGGKQAYNEEETRMKARYVQLIDEEARNRKLKRVEAQQQKAQEKQDKKDSK